MVDISGSGVVGTMNAKQRQYKALLMQAQRTNRDKGGQVSKEEARLYRDAAEVCAEIMNLNISQRDLHAQWKARMEQCEAKVEAIIEELSPGFYQQYQKDEVPDTATRTGKPAEPSKTHKAKTENKPEKTESGFQTKNACKDVSAATIEKFYKNKPNHNLMDITGMQDQIAMLQEEVDNIGYELTDEALQIDSVHGYLFYGPPGSGKTYLIEGFASELMDRGFKYIKLVGGEIHASLVGVGEKTVQIAIQEAIDNGPCILFFDEIDGVCVDRDNPNTQSNEKRLTNAFLEAWNTLTEYGKNIVLIGATNYPGNVDTAMVDRMKLVRVPLPSTEERVDYFVNKFRNLQLEDSFSVEEMAEQTGNSSYRDLDRLSKAISMKLKGMVIRENEKRKEDGSVDVKETDKAASEEILQKQVFITRDLFEEKLRQNPPSDKSKVRKSLEEFERSRSEADE